MNCWCFFILMRERSRSGAQGILDSVELGLALAIAPKVETQAASRSEKGEVYGPREGAPLSPMSAAMTPLWLHQSLASASSCVLIYRDFRPHRLQLVLLPLCTPKRYRPVTLAAARDSIV